MKLAAAFDIDGIRVERPDDLGPALRKAIGSGKPMVVDVALDDSFDSDRIQRDWGAWLMGRG